MSVLIHVAGCLIRIAVLSPSIRAASTGGSFVESMIRIERNAALCPTRFSCTRVQRRRTVWCGTRWPSFRFARRRTRRTLIVGSSVPTKITSTRYPPVAASRNRPRRHCRVNVVSMPKLAPAARHLARAAATSGHRPSRSVVASRLKNSSGSSSRCCRVQRDLPAPLAPINSTTLGGATLIRFPEVPSTVPGTSSRASGNRWAGGWPAAQRAAGRVWWRRRESHARPGLLGTAVDMRSHRFPAGSHLHVARSPAPCVSARRGQHATERRRIPPYGAGGGATRP